MLLEWAEGQTRCPVRVTDHAGVYGLPDGGLRPAAALLPLAPGAAVCGRAVCRIGTDLYLETTAGLVLADTRLLAGWAFHRAPPETPFSAALEAVRQPQGEQEGLY